MINLDTQILRTFVTAAELGGLAHAAQRVGRSQGAVSMQIQKLEDVIGHQLFVRGKQGVDLTEAGERLLEHATRILELNDKAVSDLRGYDVEGVVRFGMPQDFAETFLPSLLGAFARTHPSVHLAAQVDRNSALLQAVRNKTLDLALTFGSGSDENARKIAKFPSVWVGRDDFDPGKVDLIPLVAFEPPCMFREMATDALDKIGRKWTVTMTSPSLPGLWAGATAGLGITARTPLSIPASLRILGTELELPSLPEAALWLHRTACQRNLAVDRLENLLIDKLEGRPWIT